LPQVGAALQCPVPRHVHLTAPLPAAGTPNSADFPTGSPPCVPNTFGGTSSDTCFRHTFTLPVPSELCCQCVESKKNTLTLRYQALVAGPHGSATSGNDNVGFYSNHQYIAGTSQDLYPGGATKGQIVTKTIPLRCSWLANNRLSFNIQDDTSVLSATLDVDLCCVRK